MDDSGIWYYILLGAIYILSKMFGKKKAPEASEPVDAPELHPEDTANTPPKKRRATPTFEELLRELTEEVAPKELETPIPESPKPVAKEPAPVPQIVDYQQTNIEAVKPDEEIDIPGHRPIERKKPEYKRSEKYKIEVESHEVRDGVQELLADHSGLQKAFVLKEVLDRKY